MKPMLLGEVVPEEEEEAEGVGEVEEGVDSKPHCLYFLFSLLPHC